MTHHLRSKRILAGLWMALFSQLPLATAADMTATVPAGSGFAVKNADGTLDRFRVQESGTVFIPSLSSATPNTNLTCFDGPTGRLGPCTGGAVSQAYGHMYNSSAQTVAVEADIIFDSSVVGTGISHTPGSTQITILENGFYSISWIVSAVEPNQFGLFVNGNATRYVYGSGAGTQQNTGQAVIELLAGDVITLRNHSSAAAVTLQTLAGGTQINVNASIMIRK